MPLQENATLKASLEQLSQDSARQIERLLTEIAALKDEIARLKAKLKTFTDKLENDAW